MKKLIYDPIPYEEIKRIADNILKEYCPDDRLPIDIEKIIEAQGINLIPVQGFKQMTSVLAALSADFKEIYYDGYLDNGKNLFHSRVILAHEFSHYILHRDILEDFPWDSFKYWKEALQRIYNNASQIEVDANVLAGALLVPKRLLQPYEERNALNIDIARQFQVTVRLIETRRYFYKN